MSPRGVGCTHLDAVFMNMARVGNEEEHLQAAKSQLQVLRRGFVGRFAHCHACLLVFLFNFLWMSADKGDSIVGDQLKEVPVCAAPKASCGRKDTDFFMHTYLEMVRRLQVPSKTTGVLGS